MSVINKIIGGLMVAGVLTAPSCGKRWDETDVVDKQVRKVMADKPFDDYKKATANWRDGAAGLADAQSTLDSVAYRKVFESTQGVKDSALVKEFNQIAAQNRVPQSLKKNFEVDNAFLDIAKKHSVADYDAVRGINAFYYGVEIAQRQHAVDSIAYNKFFRENNLLNSDTTQMVKQQVEKMIKPVKRQMNKYVTIKYL